MQKTKRLSINIIFLFLFILVSFELKAQNQYDVSLKKNESAPIDTSEFMKQFPTILNTDWYDGMRFIVEPMVYPNDFDRLDLYKYGTFDFLDRKKRLLYKDYQWEIFEFKKIEYRDTIINEKLITNTFYVFKHKNELYELCPMVGKESINKIELKHLIYLGDIDKAKQLLVGKTYYTLHKNGNDDKFISVRITDVGLGKKQFPIRIVYELSNGKKSEILASFSKTNNRGSFTSLNTFIKINNLDEFFTEKNPKLKYPNISDDVWALIKKEKVKVGMFEEECILSWGKPSEINKTSYSPDQWVYGNSYLYFENGKLVAFN